jgi:hypothetical protein
VKNIEISCSQPDLATALNFSIFNKVCLIWTQKTTTSLAITRQPLSSWVTRILIHELPCRAHGDASEHNTADIGANRTTVMISLEKRTFL